MIRNIFKKLKEKIVYWLVKLGFMGKIVYTLKEYKTGEYHLFEGVKTDEFNCTSARLSVCQEMDKKDKVGDNIFTCEDEFEARRLCAIEGRKVCGTCVSHLYADKKKK